MHVNCYLRLSRSISPDLALAWDSCHDSCYSRTADLIGAEADMSDHGGRGTQQERITRDVRTQIEAGVLRDGESLPSTRELAAKWETSVFTVSEALKVLAEEGLIENVSRSRRVVRYERPQAVAQSTRAPRVILIGGYAGSGKTELGRIFTRLTGWPIIDKDTTTRPVVEAALEAMGAQASDRESETYLSKIRPREYEALMATAHENTMCGAGVIITAPFIREFSDEAWLRRERGQFADDGVPVSVVWVSCDAESMLTYLRRRGVARDAHKLAHWDEYLAGVDVDFRPVGEHHVIDNSISADPLRDQAEKLLAGLAEATN